MGKCWVRPYKAMGGAIIKNRVPFPLSYIGVGLSDKNAPLSRLPGWDKCSYGYHADDGKAFCGASNAGEDYGPMFTTGDVIGCGLNFVDRTIFYTKNGINLGVCVCVCVCVCVSVSVSVSVSVCLSVYLFVHPSVCLSVCLWLCMSYSGAICKVVQVYSLFLSTGTAFKDVPVGGTRHTSSVLCPVAPFPSLHSTLPPTLDQHSTLPHRWATDSW